MSCILFIAVNVFVFLWIVSAQLNTQIKTIEGADVRIHRVPQIIQKQRILEEHWKCIQLMIDSSNESFIESNKRKTCNITWDSIRCWPETPVGTILYASCPDYIDGLKVDGNVTKECLVSGNWYSKKGIPWTNYSDCRPKKNNAKLMHYKIIRAIGQIGYAVSMMSLILASAILSGFRRLNCERNKMHVSLFISFLLRAFLYYLTLNNYQKKNERSNNRLVLCRVIKTAQNYAILANNTCISVEAAYLHNILFYHTFTAAGNRLFYYISVAWALPAVITLVWVILRIQFDNLFCWDAHDDPYKRDFWVIQAFTIALTLGNVLLFVNLVRSIYSKMMAQPVHEMTFTRRIAHSTSVLVVVFGVYNLIFIPIDIAIAVAPTNKYMSSLELMKLYCEHMISSCQGLLVSILFCFIHREVHAEIKRFVFRRFNYHPSNFRNQSSLLRQRCPKRLLPVTSSSTANGFQTENLIK